MDMVGELGASFNTLSYALTRRQGADRISQSLEIMAQQIYRLQDEVLQYRLQPIGRIWNSYHRLVRDLAVATGKRVRLELAGENTEVDRNVLLSLKESLGHMIRNAIDHGIEPELVRKEAGKPVIGTLRMSAEQRHGQVYVELTDDGKGIDQRRVLDKALQKGLIGTAQAADMREEEILKLVLLPGFSTTDQVSRLSGRGTGMDVVKTAVEKIGGTIQISSTPGQGSCFRLRIPQTISIVPTLLVRCMGQGYVIPQLNIVELLSYYGDEIGRHVENKMQHPMVRSRDHLLPLLSLRTILAEAEAEGASGGEEAALHVVVLQSDDRLFALAVDRIEEPISLVIKPMPRLFASVTLFSGTAVMPDGSVAFLLNVPGFQQLLD
jgi:two-component system chemotaxis sensor kinase CheA